LSSRLDAALAELAAAIRDELRDELAERARGPPELLDIRTAAARLSLGRTAVYGAITRGELRSVKVGRRRLIPADALASLAQRAVPTNGTAQEVRRASADTPTSAS
jgi:excisionase family DNA binding protein